MWNKKSKKFIVSIVLFIAGFSLIFGSFIMLLGSSNSTDEYQKIDMNVSTQKTGNTEEKQNIQDNESKNEDNESKVKEVTVDTNVDEIISEDVHQKNIQLLEGNELLKKYEFTPEQFYKFLYQVDSLNVDFKELRKMGEKLEKMQDIDKEEYKKTISPIRKQIEENLNIVR